MKSDHPTADAEPTSVAALRWLTKVAPDNRGERGGPRVSWETIDALFAYIDRLSQKPATVSGEEPGLAELATANEHANILGERCQRLSEELADAKREVAELRERLLRATALVERVKERVEAMPLRPAPSQSSGNSK